MSFLVNSYRSTVAPLKINYTCSLCSLVFRWRKCCESQLGLYVQISLNMFSDSLNLTKSMS